MKKSALPIATPCGENWEAMSPDGGGRLCATCDKVVHDLSSLGEARAKRLLASKGNLCVRYLFDERGNIWFAGETPPLAARLLDRAKRGAAVAFAIAAPLSLQACMGSMPYESPNETTDAGEDGDGGGGFVGSDPSVDTDAGGSDSADAGVSDDASDGSNEDGGDGGL